MRYLENNTFFYPLSAKKKDYYFLTRTIGLNYRISDGTSCILKYNISANYLNSYILKYNVSANYLSLTIFMLNDCAFKWKFKKYLTKASHTDFLRLSFSLMKQFKEYMWNYDRVRKLSQNLSRRLLIGRWINIEARVSDGPSRQTVAGTDYDFARTSGKKKKKRRFRSKRKRVVRFDPIDQWRAYGKLLKCIPVSINIHIYMYICICTIASFKICVLNPVDERQFGIIRTLENSQNILESFRISSIGANE